MPSVSTTEGSIAVDLMTHPSGARLPSGNVTVLVKPRLRAASGDMMTLSGSTLSRVRQQFAEARAALGLRPPVEVLSERVARRRERVEFEQAEFAQVQHHLRHAAGEEHPHRRVVHRAVRQRVHQPRHAAVVERPVVDGRPLDAGVERDRRRVQQQVRTAAERGEHRERVLERRFGEDVPRVDAAVRHVEQRRRRARRQVEPDRLPRRRQRRVRQTQAERFADDLRRGRGAEELTPAAGTRARVAPRVRRFVRSSFRRARSARRSSAPCPCLRGRLRRRASPRREPESSGGRAARPAPSSSRAGPCRTSRRPSRRPASGGCASTGASLATSRCDTAGCRTCRRCPGCGRRTDR